MPIYQLGDDRPDIDPAAFVFENAVIIGKVRIAARASVWPFVTIRGDVEPIAIGVGSNVQEGCVLHTDLGYPLTIEDHVTVGHQATLHGCTIGTGSLIGIQAVVLNGVRIGRNCLIGAGALVTEGKVIPDNSLVIGAPAKVARALSEADIAGMHSNTGHYLDRGIAYGKQLVRIG